jgi:hypothetical protein
VLGFGDEFWGEVDIGVNGDRVRSNARDIVLEPHRQVEYSLEKVDDVSQDGKVLLRVQRIRQEMRLGNPLKIDLEAV